MVNGAVNLILKKSIETCTIHNKMDNSLHSNATTMKKKTQMILKLLAFRVNGQNHTKLKLQCFGF